MPPSSYKSKSMDEEDTRIVPSRPSKSRPPRTTPKKWNNSNNNSNSGISNSNQIVSNTSTNHNSIHNHLNINSSNTFPSATDNDVLSQHTTNSTPSSILAGAAPLVRDLSDLSGSYMNGSTTPRHHQYRSNSPHNSSTDNIYPSDQSNTSYHRPWRLAKVLSAREPLHPQPFVECDDSIGILQKSAVVMARNGVVEVVEPPEQTTNREDDNSTSTGNILTSKNSMTEDLRRIPLIILLMDVGRKVYELMQLWIDVEDDTIRNIVHAVQQNLGKAWRQDYDGLFQVRNHRFNQLIHILNVSKYDVQPYEVCVAKPWAMSAKTAINYASTALQHLQSNNTLEYIACSQLPQKHVRTVTPTQDDQVLCLSKVAKSRIYVPDGILKHRHACQYLNFAPPFEPAIRVDVLSADVDDANSQLSESVGDEMPSVESMLSLSEDIGNATTSTLNSPSSPRQSRLSPRLTSETVLAQLSIPSSPTPVSGLHSTVSKSSMPEQSTTSVTKPIPHVDTTPNVVTERPSFWRFFGSCCRSISVVNTHEYRYKKDRDISNDKDYYASQYQSGTPETERSLFTSAEGNFGDNMFNEYNDGGALALRPLWRVWEGDDCDMNDDGEYSRYGASDDASASVVSDSRPLLARAPVASTSAWIRSDWCQPPAPEQKPPLLKDTSNSSIKYIMPYIMATSEI